MSFWSSIRVAEAWQEGLDVIAITDHLEYHPHADDIPVQFGRAYEIAKPHVDNMGLLLIRAAEITRGMPPGHFYGSYTIFCNLTRATECKFNKQ